MKKFFLLLTFAIPSLLFAQIPNPGFEDTIGEYPDGWYPIHTYTGFSLTRKAQKGHYALKMSTSPGIDAVAAGLYTRDLNSEVPELVYGYRITEMPRTITGYYKLTGGGCGKANATAMVFNYSVTGEIEVIARGTVDLDYREKYAKFTIPLEVKASFYESAWLAIDFRNEGKCQGNACCSLFLDNFRYGGIKPPMQRSDNGSHLKRTDKGRK